MPATLGPMNRPWMNRSERSSFDQDYHDIVVTVESTLVLFRPISNAGREFVRSFEGPETQYFGSALVVEQRYAADVAEAAIDEGLALY